MTAAGAAAPTIAAFLGAVRQVAAGESGMLAESSIEPIRTLPRLVGLPVDWTEDESLLREVVVVKLNGGLGTSMGLERPRSLLPVKGSDTFLDFIARQIVYLRARTGRSGPSFYLLDSAATQRDTLEYLQKYPELSHGEPLDFLQSMVPKIDPETLEPVSWPAQPELEWCPPGHGDLYPSLLGSGLLDRLLARGIRFMFASNADNLGATVDLTLLRYFAEQGRSFLMEVAERTAMDRKGGHLARYRDSGRFVLRESAQCPAEDEAAFQDISRHRFFNTNSIWVRLDHLKRELDSHGGALPLPLITNAKRVDPRRPESAPVLQLESAMGAAIQCFEQSSAIVVPRTRFTPVKTTSDLLVLRSDACRITDDQRLQLDERRNGQPPRVDLEPEHYQLLSDFEELFAEGPPSLIACDSLRVSGRVRFAASVTCKGDVEFINTSSDAKTVASGIYEDVKVQL
ncbi:MAG: UTP--glucose-1-phosphate uridylyltransferase [Chloroflexi bacterium]|nr:UTP--glucose-1-phosphate uridylyltransferase [Chloroflexota bacterium]